MTKQPTHTSSVKVLSDGQREWLLGYRDLLQNGKTYDTPSVWTRANGNSFRGLRSCRRAGLIVSTPDAKIRAGGWRHDITAAGLAALERKAP